MRDSLINIGPLKDFSYGLRINADLNATGIAKQSNYELVGVANCHYCIFLIFVNNIYIYINFKLTPA